MSRSTPEWLHWVAGASAAAAGSAAAGEPARSPSDQSVTAWIASEPAGTGLTFTGFVRAERPLEGRYELVAERHGASGRTRTVQGGRISAGGGAPVRLSHTSLAPLGPDDHFSVVLTVFEGDQPVASDEQSR